MHELLLFASIPARQHHDLLQQLAGLTAMQPNPVFERHLVFRAYRKPGYTNTYRSGGSQDVHSSEMQKLNKQLNGGLFFTQVVGSVRGTDFGTKPTEGMDVTMSDADGPQVAQQTGGEEAQKNTVEAGYDFENQAWRMEFRDIPEAGIRTAVTSRLMGMATIPRGDVVAAMDSWGYNYISEYIIEGNKFILDDIVIFLHRVLNFPADAQEDLKAPRRHLPPLKELQPLDPSGGYVLQAAITVQESNNPDLLRAASQHLLALKERLKAVVKLEPADRLALDTRAR